jgi:hypothetical protein
MADDSADRLLAVVDLDGVVADVRHRLRHIQGRRKNWDAFFADAVHDDVHPEGLAAVEALAAEHDLVFLTGRPERCRADTEAWLERHGLGGHKVVMRPEGDRQPAASLKRKLLGRMAPPEGVVLVVDDDTAVCESLRAAGYRVKQADWEKRALDEDAALRRAQEDQGRT